MLLRVDTVSIGNFVNRWSRALAFALLGAQALAAQDDVAFPIIRNFSPRHYQAQPQNWAVIQDLRGVVYVGNNDGVLEYDGVRWKLIPLPTVSSIRSLARDDSGRIYVGSVGEFGVLRQDGRRGTVYESLTHRIDSTHRDFSDVWQMFHADGRLILRTRKYVLLVPPYGSPRVLESPQGFHKAFLVRNRFYVRKEGEGLFVLRGDSLEAAPHGETFAEDRIYAMTELGVASTLLVARNSGLWLMSTEGIRPLRKPYSDWLIKMQVYGGCVLNDGRVGLATTFGGLAVLDTNAALECVIDKRSGLQDNNVWFPYVDRDGAVWTALNNGISRIEMHSPVSLYGENAGILGSVQTILRHRGQLYVGTSAGVFVNDKNHPTTFRAIEKLNGQGWSFLSTGEDLFVGTTQGVYTITGDRAVRQGRARAVLKLMRSARDSTLYYECGSAGLFVMRVRGHQWTEELRVPTVEDELIDMQELPNGEVWVATHYKGVLRVHPDGWSVRRYTTIDGLPAGRQTLEVVDGRLVVMVRNGLYALDASGERFMIDPGLGEAAHDTTHEIKYFRSSGKELWIVRFIDQRFETQVYRQIHDRFQLQSGNLFERIGHYRILHVLAEGDVSWFGTPDGLIRFDHRHVPHRPQNFRALVRRVSLVKLGEEYHPEAETDASPSFPFRGNAVRLEFAAMVYEEDTRRPFAYRLEGYDDEWQPWTSEAGKEYTHLPAGSYRFRVKARNGYGEISEEGTYAFRILAPWYQNLWFIGLVGALFSLTVYGIVRFRNRRLEADRKRLEELVSERTAELKRLNDQKDEYLGIVAHDLRNPLTNIIGYVKLVVTDMELATFTRSQSQSDLQLVLHSAENMQRMISGLLNIAAIEAGKLHLQWQPCRMTELIEQCAQFHRRYYEQKKIRLVVRTPELPVVSADRDRIIEVMDNLLSNAAKYTYEGGEVTVRGESDDKEVTVHVQDNGQGMTEDDLQRAFQYFEKLSATPTGGESSTGLGLAIVKKIVELHGGRVWASSEKGTGSTFSFTLPVRQAVS